MENEKQIVLFLKPNQSFSEVQLAAKINERHSTMGDPITLPYDSENENNPLILFNKGIMNFSINRKDASFVFKEKNEKECMKILEDILEIIEDFEIEFMRMGYVTTHLHSNKEKESFTKKLFNDPSLLSEEFNLAWYKSELIDSVRVNVWERHLTDMINKVEFVTIIDINTPMDKEYNITKEFVIDFIKKCDKYIETKLENRF